jgi:repressor LexA
MQKLTDRQQAVLSYISESIGSRGFPPTLREIGNHLGIRSTNGVNDHLRALERKGYLTREDMKSRTLRPTNMGQPASHMHHVNSDANTVSVPIMGRVAAGLLTEAVEHNGNSVHIDSSLIGTRNQDVFGLRIAGDSMIEAGIHDGDYVFVRKQPSANRGDIIIALIGDEATCKYYYPEREHIRLEPANASMAPILIPKNDWRTSSVVGVVVGVFRSIAA